MGERQTESSDRVLTAEERAELTGIAREVLVLIIRNGIDVGKVGTPDVVVEGAEQFSRDLIIEEARRIGAQALGFSLTARPGDVIEEPPPPMISDEDQRILGEGNSFYFSVLTGYNSEIGDGATKRAKAFFKHPLHSPHPPEEPGFSVSPFSAAIGRALEADVEKHWALINMAKNGHFPTVYAFDGEGCSIATSSDSVPKETTLCVYSEDVRNLLLRDNPEIERDRLLKAETIMQQVGRMRLELFTPEEYERCMRGMYEEEEEQDSSTPQEAFSRQEIDSDSMEKRDDIQVSQSESDIFVQGVLLDGDDDDYYEEEEQHGRAQDNDGSGCILITDPETLAQGKILVGRGYDKWEREVNIEEVDFATAFTDPTIGWRGKIDLTWVNDV